MATVATTATSALTFNIRLKLFNAFPVLSDPRSRPHNSHITDRSGPPKIRHPRRWDIGSSDQQLNAYREVGRTGEGGRPAERQGRKQTTMSCLAYNWGYGRLRPPLARTFPAEKQKNSFRSPLRLQKVSPAEQSTHTHSISWNVSTGCKWIPGWFYVPYLCTPKYRNIYVHILVLLVYEANNCRQKPKKLIRVFCSTFTSSTAIMAISSPSLSQQATCIKTSKTDVTRKQAAAQRQHNW